MLTKPSPVNWETRFVAFVNTIEATEVIINHAEIGCVQRERNKKILKWYQTFIIFIDACILKISFLNFLIFVIEKLFELISTQQLYSTSFNNKTI